MILQQFFTKVKEYLAANNALYAPLKFDMLDVKTDSLSFRFIPSVAAEQYYQPPFIRNLQFQVMAKSAEQLKALNGLNKIRNLLVTRGLQLEDTTFMLVRLDVYGEIQFVEVTAKQEYIYTALFSVEVEQK